MELLIRAKLAAGCGGLEGMSGAPWPGALWMTMRLYRKKRRKDHELVHG